MLKAPWPQNVVDSINKHQNNPMIHPYTCATHSETPLHACSSELYCPERGCTYIQEWVHDFHKDKPDA
jgi:hypothetical protein